MIYVHEKRYEYMEEINHGIIKQIPRNNTEDVITVLDVGCGGGALSDEIKKKGYIVWGIENNKNAALKAAKRIHKVINHDLTDYSVIKSEIKNQKFDYIILSDVLEHVYDPFSVLREYMTFLKDHGFLLVSVPNTVVWTNRISFLLGYFDYSDTGVMDRTHIRFFTFKTIINLVKVAGCSIVKVDYTPYFIRVLLPVIKKIFLAKKNNNDTYELIDSPFYKIYMKYIYPLEYYAGYFLKTLFAFRIIIVGRKNKQNETA